MKTSQPRLITTCTMELFLASPAEHSSGKQTMEKTRDQRNGSKTQSHFCDQYGSCPDVLLLASCRAQRGKGIVRSLCRFFSFWSWSLSLVILVSRLEQIARDAVTKPAWRSKIYFCIQNKTQQIPGWDAARAGWREPSSKTRGGESSGLNFLDKMLSTSWELRWAASSRGPRATQGGRSQAQVKLW